MAYFGCYDVNRSRKKTPLKSQLHKLFKHFSICIEEETFEMSDNTDRGGGDDCRTYRQLHPILVNTSSAGSGEDPFFKLGPMRPRANTDPTSPRPPLRVHFDLPDIIVDDCSEDELERIYSPDAMTKELTNSEEGAFFVYTSPPRQRSNTCPSNMFRKKLDRPPTPPPSDRVSKEGFNRHISKDKVSFSPHKLTKVTEDVPDLSKSTDRKGPQHKTPSRKPTHIPGTTALDGRQSRNVCKTTRHCLDSPTASPKRTGAKPSSVHSHRTTATNSVRDVIHSTA